MHSESIAAKPLAAPNLYVQPAWLVEAYILSLCIQFANLHELQTHLAVHQLHMCKLCAQHRKLFIQEVPLCTKVQLDAHLVGDDGSDGHPRCEFCRGTRFFGKEGSGTVLFARTAHHSVQNSWTTCAKRISNAMCAPI